MNNIIIGQYVPGTSFLYKMDPRSKILSLMILMVTAFILKDVTHILIMLVIVLAILKIGGIPIGRIIKGLKPVLILLTFTFVFQVLFVKDGTVLLNQTLTVTSYNIGIAVGIVALWFILRRVIKYRFTLLLVTVFSVLAIFSLYNTSGTELSSSTLVIYSEGLKGALFIMIRLVIIVTMSTILTLTTKPTDLNLGLEKIMKPFKYIGLNAEELAMIISIALRYIPTLLDEANKIMLAQASRGVDFSEGKFKDKVMQIISLLVPMFIISFKRSDELANAMEARNFIPGKLRTRIHTLQWRGNDTATMVFAMFLLASAITVRIVLG